jgi:hypothetical protein
VEFFKKIKKIKKSEAKAIKTNKIIIFLSLGVK